MVVEGDATEENCLECVAVLDSFWRPFLVRG